jgi:predicted aspartyl protease
MDSRYWLLGAIVAAACGAGACSTNDDTQKGTPTPVDIVLSPYLSRLVTVDAVINGDTVGLRFDTGGGETVISPEVADRIGCSPAGRSVGYRMNGDRIDVTLCRDVTVVIGGVSSEHEQLGVWDLQSLLPAEAPPIDGVLSLKTLAAQPFTLDLQRGQLTLETEASFDQRIQGMTRLQSRMATGTDGDELTVFVRGEVDSEGWFLLDSGNLDVVQAAPYLSGAASGASSEPWQHDLALSGLPGIATSFRTRDIIYDGVLSEQFMRNLVFAFDLESNEVWAAVNESNR